MKEKTDIDLQNVDIIDVDVELPLIAQEDLEKEEDGTIRIEKFHTKTVSLLSFLIFEKCRFHENYPCMFRQFIWPPYVD